MSTQTHKFSEAASDAVTFFRQLRSAMEAVLQKQVKTLDEAMLRQLESGIAEFISLVGTNDTFDRAWLDKAVMLRKEIKRITTTVKHQILHHNMEGAAAVISNLDNRYVELANTLTKLGGEHLKEIKRYRNSQRGGNYV